MLFLNNYICKKEMNLPKFLIADNSNDERLYVLHTEFPCFILDTEEGDIKFFEEVDEEEAEGEISSLIKEAYTFYDAEMQKYNEDYDE